MVSVNERVKSFLGFDYVYLTSEIDERGCFCEIGGVSREAWLIRCAAHLEAGRFRLHVHFEKYELIFLISLSKTDGNNSYLGFIKQGEGLKSSFEIELDKKVAYLERNEAFWNKRREERVVIGAEGFEKFGLSSIKQEVYIAGEKFPCVINDVSRRGLCFTTYAHDYLTGGSRVSAALLFVNPLERIEVEGIIRNVVVKGGVEKSARAAFVSLELDGGNERYENRVGMIEG